MAFARTGERWLALAAAPTFALLAVVNLLAGDSHAGLLCWQAQPSWVPTGMTPMYLLMAVFHISPWFSLWDRAALRP